MPNDRRWAVLGLCAILVACASDSNPAGPLDDVTRSVASIVIQPRDQTLSVGQAVVLMAKVRDGQGRDLPDSVVTWSLSNAVAALSTQSPAVEITGLAAGVAYLRAAAGGLADSVRLVVQSNPGRATISFGHDVSTTTRTAITSLSTLAENTDAGDVSTSLAVPDPRRSAIALATNDADEPILAVLVKGGEASTMNAASTAQTLATLALTPGFQEQSAPLSALVQSLPEYAALEAAIEAISESGGSFANSDLVVNALRSLAARAAEIDGQGVTPSNFSTMRMFDSLVPSFPNLGTSVTIEDPGNSTGYLLTNFTLLQFAASSVDVETGAVIGLATLHNRTRDYITTPPVNVTLPGQDGRTRIQIYQNEDTDRENLASALYSAIVGVATVAGYPATATMHALALELVKATASTEALQAIKSGDAALAATAILNTLVSNVSVINDWFVRDAAGRSLNPRNAVALLKTINVVYKAFDAASFLYNHGAYLFQYASLGSVSDQVEICQNEGSFAPCINRYQAEYSYSYEAFKVDDSGSCTFRVQHIGDVTILAVDEPSGNISANLEEVINWTSVASSPPGSCTSLTLESGRHLSGSRTGTTFSLADEQYFIRGDINGGFVNGTLGVIIGGWFLTMGSSGNGSVQFVAK